ncbi:hypothetical protein ScPMuIL_008925 [Solemya velum]
MLLLAAINGAEHCFNWSEMKPRVCELGCCGDSLHFECCTHLTGIIIGVAIGGLALIGGIALVVFYCIMKSKGRSLTGIRPGQGKVLAPPNTVAYTTPNTVYPVGQPTIPPPAYYAPPGYSMYPPTVSVPVADLTPQDYMGQPAVANEATPPPAYQGHMGPSDVAK